jgi:hypothetical protein
VGVVKGEKAVTIDKGADSKRNEAGEAVAQL